MRKKKNIVIGHPKKNLPAKLKNKKVFHFYNNNTTVVCTSSVFGTTFVGIARLKEGDNMDIKTAMYIAETKMERSFYKYLLQSVTIYLKDIEGYRVSAEKNINYYKRNIEACTNHIIDLCNNSKE